MDEDEALAYGVGGGDPARNLSLWINGRLVIKHGTWWAGRATSEEYPWIAAMVIRGGKFTLCRRTGSGYDPAPVTCAPGTLASAPSPRTPRRGAGGH